MARTLKQRQAAKRNLAKARAARKRRRSKYIKRGTGVGVGVLAVSLSGHRHYKQHKAIHSLKARNTQLEDLSVKSARERDYAVGQLKTQTLNLRRSHLSRKAGRAGLN